MADSKKTESVSTAEQTVYVTEESPKLPTADVAASRDLPVIDKRLVEARNAEAKAMADRFK
jgi:hypothetical protein